MKDLVTNGPITAGFAVYKDFMAYKSGKTMLMFKDDNTRAMS